MATTKKKLTVTKVEALRKSENAAKKKVNEDTIKEVVSKTEAPLSKREKTSIKFARTDLVDTSAFVFNDDPKSTADKIGILECSCCGEKKSKAKFVKTMSLKQKSRQYLETCNDCTEALWRTYLKKFPEDWKRALYYFCMLVDVAYFKEVAEEILTQAKIPVEQLPQLYLLKVYSIAIVSGAGTFIDGQLISDGFNEENMDASFEGFDDEGYKPTTADIRRWGKLKNPGDVFFLKQEYDDWCGRYEVTQKSMEEVIKQICFKQLRIHRANETGENTSKELKDLQDLMGSANLKPVQGKGLSGDENTFGNWIKKFENEKPIPQPDPEFQDVDGIWKKMRIWFLGHMCKILNYDTEYSHEYEQEMSKYRVQNKEKVKPIEEKPKPKYDVLEGPY